MDKKLSRREIILILAIIVVVLVLLYSGLRIADGLIRGKDSEDPVTNSRVIVRDGVSYYPRQDIVTFLVAGIDEEGPVQNSGSYNNPGEADMITLVILDQKTRKIDMLSLNRDTMVDMPVLGVDGKKAGTYHGQLALAHTYGSGLQDSAENLKTTVSQLLYGLEIDHYVTMNMDAIEILNDSVGGVTVTVEDDFSAVDESIGMGQVKLNGQQAVSFLRSRYQVGDQLNLTRMKRQEHYMSAFFKELRRCLEADAAFSTTVYEDLEPYMVTSISSAGLLGLVEFYSDYENGQTYRLEGENKVNKYMEYHLDEQSLDETVLKLFYAPKA